MDFFQGSSPPNFIPFCLDKQHSRNDATPDPGSNTNPASSKACSPPHFPPLKASTNQTQARVLNSPHSMDSNVDVTAYATEMAQRMKAAQCATGPEVLGTVRDEAELGCSPKSTLRIQSSDQIRKSTPTPPDQSILGAVSISQLESVLRIVSTSHTEFPELQFTPGTSKETSVASFLQQKEDASSSLCDPSPLPEDTGQVRNLGAYSEGDKTGDAQSLHVPIRALTEVMKLELRVATQANQDRLK